MGRLRFHTAKPPGMGALNMHQPIAQLTQSQYYSPTLNAAIFDGPIRLYFAQSQEPQALEIYFRMQKEILEKYELAKQYIQQDGQNIFILLYPSDEVFEQSCGDSMGFESGVVLQKLGDDSVLGVRGPVGELEFVRIQEGLFRIFNSYRSPEPSLNSAL